MLIDGSPMKYSPCYLVSAMKNTKTWNGIGFVIMVLHREKRQMNKYKDKSRLARILRKVAKTCLAGRQVCLSAKWTDSVFQRRTKKRLKRKKRRFSKDSIFINVCI